MYKKFIILSFIMLFCLFGCASGIDKSNKTEAELEQIRIAEISSAYIAIGSKIKDTKKEIIHQCEVNVLFSNEDCLEAKTIYNYISDIYYSLREISIAVVDKENSIKHISKAVLELSDLTKSDIYSKIPLDSINNIIKILGNEDLSDIEKSDKILGYIELELIKLKK